MKISKNRTVRDIGIGIFVAIITSSFSQSFFLWLWSIVGNSSFVCYKWFANYVIKRAATGITDQSQDLLLLLIISGVVIYFLDLLVQTYSLNKKIDELENNAYNKEDNKRKEKKLQTLDDVRASIKRLRKKLSFAKILLTSGFVFQIIVLVVILSTTSIPTELNIKFNQKLNIISPFVSDQQIKIYRGQWALMQNVEDYNIISNKINSTIKQLNTP